MQDIKNRLEKETSLNDIVAFSKIYRAGRKSRVKYWFYGAIGFIVFMLFLPWTRSLERLHDALAHFCCCAFASI